jgi:hypothetical protein
MDLLCLFNQALPPNEHSLSFETLEKEESKEQTTKRTTPNTAHVQ